MSPRAGGFGSSNPGMGPGINRWRNPIGRTSFAAQGQAVPGQLGYDPQGRMLPPQAAPTPQAPTPAPAAVDPRDADYTNQVSRLVARNKQARDELGQQGQYDQQDFDQAISRLGAARTDDLTSTDQGANRQGLFYSGQLGMRRGKVETDYRNRENDARGAFDRRAAARRSALEGLGEIGVDEGSPLGFRGTGGAGLDLTDLYNAAVARRIEADQNRVVPTPEPQQEIAAPLAVSSAPALQFPGQKPLGPGINRWRNPTRRR